MTTTLNVGDSVLYVKAHGARPAAGNVHKVTKTQARVTLVDGTEAGPFKREAWNGQHEVIKSSSYRTYSAVWAKTDEREAELNASADRCEKEAAEKKALAEARQKAYDGRVANELAEVREACGSPLGFLPPMIKKIMPDGIRLYVASIPVKKEYAERKAGWEELIVRCEDKKYYDFRKDEVKVGVESHVTYTNGSSGSFSSCSSVNYADDSEAIWDAISRCYHSW